MAFGDPISTSTPGYATKNNLVTQPTASSWWGPNIQFPYPTNTWFMDFILPTTAELQAVGADRRTSTWPYMVQAQDDGLAFHQPFIRTSPDGRTLANEYRINYDPTATNWGWTSDASPQMWRRLDLTFSATETTTSRYLDRYDQLTATLRWNVDASHYMEAPIVKGMPYVTMRYTGLTPHFQTSDTDYHAIETVNGVAPGGSVSGTKFTLTVNRPYLGADATETWIIYASAPITFTTSISGLAALTPFTGYLRAAIIPTAASSEEALLDTYAHAVPIAGHASVHIEEDTSTTTFSYTKTGAGSTLLLYVLPHHEDTLDSANYASDLAITTIRGQLRAAIGNTWTMFDQLSTITWDSPNAIDNDKQPAIEAALATEKELQASHLDASEAYRFGKQIARAARLALIAHQLTDTAARDTILATVKAHLNPWLDNNADATASRSLMYDATWGGIIANSAHAASPPDAPQDATQESGHAVYNNHHLQWGYFIYAAAVLARFDTAWTVTYQTKVNDIIRDIANPSLSDPHFTQLRHFDWYEGHSWTDGLQVHGNGRRHTSTAEAVNAWYGINLWGLATSQSDIYNLGRYLQAKETHAATLYTQMPSYNTVYPTDFAAQKIAPLVFANQVASRTPTGSIDDDVRVGVETAPFTPVSHELLPNTWAEEVFSSILADNAATATAHTPGGWLGYTYATQAIVAPNSAYENIEADIAPSDNNQYLDKYGTSKTNLLWWSAVQGASGPTPISTITTLGATPESPADEGATVILTATISPAAAGIVTFRDGIEVLDSTTANNGVASITTALLSPGPHSLTAMFAPFDTAYAGSSSSAMLYTISGADPTATATTLSISPTNGTIQGAVVMITATITPSAPGSVEFRNGAAAIATVPVTNGSAIMTTTSLPIGGHALSAAFTPTDLVNYTGSVSNNRNYTIYAPGATDAGSTASSATFVAFTTGQPHTAIYRAIADDDYTVSPTDTIIALTSLTASRTITLPHPGTCTGRIIVIKDESGACQSSTAIAISGSIDGNDSYVLNTAFAVVRLYAGDSNWHQITP